MKTYPSINSFTENASRTFRLKVSCTSNLTKITSVFEDQYEKYLD
jgi:hypothetical protein